jgi:carboxypeptidase C (cathepsin A)
MLGAAVPGGVAPSAVAQQARPAPQQSTPQQSTETPRGDAARPDAAARSARPAANENAPRLPADSTTEHRLEFPGTGDLPGRTLAFKATAGGIPLNDAETGNLQAEIAFIAFVNGDAGRPVTFLFNGGPGAASAYLDIGAVGPWRVPLDNLSPSATPALVPNAETWLVVIRKWLERNGRQSSVKFVVGESYGGFRVPKVARALVGQGVGVRGLVMISPVLDFASFNPARHNPMGFVTRLPSMAATVMEATAPFDRNALRDVEAYAAGDYLRDLMRGERDAEAIARMTPRVAAYTGLDPAEVKMLAARIDMRTFQRELKRGRGLVASAYDPTVTAFDPAPHAAQSYFSDPVLDAIGPPITGAMTALYQGPLKWRVDQPYRLLNQEVNGQWNWGRGRSGPEVVDDLRNAIAADRDLQALVAHGASDLVTPYFGSQIILHQLPVFGSADRLKLTVYGGGHMFYTRDASRRAFRADVQTLYRTALQRE